jgi:peptidoglycan hydrolase-like protein with peptidoglycan-binding domain
MASSSISASVGKGGVNRSDDVTTVQTLLIGRGFGTFGEADGVCGARTQAAIVAYQSGFLRKPDGRIDPGGTSWQHLAGTYTNVTTPPPAAGGSLTRQVPRPAPGTINKGLVAVNNAYMVQSFGAPRSDGVYPRECNAPPTNPRLRGSNMPRDTVGPFTVTGLLPAVLSLKAVMADIAIEQPEVYQGLGTAGMLCCRLQRGSNSAISNHSWGTAIDITINGVLDTYGNNTVQYGLTLIAPIFNRHGWYWGAAFRTEDGMHFEGSKKLIDQWATQLT